MELEENLASKNVRLEEWLQDALELFIKNYRYGEDGKSSTVLCDSYDRMVGVFDRGTKEANIIRCEGVHKGEFVYMFKWDYSKWVTFNRVALNKKIEPLLIGKDYFKNLIKETNGD